MQHAIRKYNNNLCRRIILFVFFLSAYTLVQAQDTTTVWIDTIKDLQYQVVDTVVQVPSEDNTDNDYADASDDNEKIETEYFLRREFTGGFTDTIKFRSLPGDLARALRDDEAFWYANETFKKKEPKKRKKSFVAQPFFQTLLWIVIIGGFATFLILYLHNSNIGLFRRTATISQGETDLEDSDIFSINYQKEIDKAVEAGNYRLAIRLMFLRLLRNLSDKNIIQYKQDSTNFDYIMQLRSTAMYPDFSRLTRNYEYSWYGQFAIDKETYSIIKNEFDNFETKLSR